MPKSIDLLEQFLNLPPDEQELFAMHVVRTAAPFCWNQSLADFSSVVSTPDVCGGSPRLIRTRIPVWLLQHMRQRGFSEAKILECYPTLTAWDLAQAWGYASAHRAEIAKEIEENEQY